MSTSNPAEDARSAPARPAAPAEQPSAPHHGLPHELVAALADACGRARPGAPFLVASDFDGVLAPLVDDPTTSRPTPAAAHALVRLAGLGPERVRLALVSGRNLDALAELSHPPSGTLLVGSHGAERGEVHGTGTSRTVERTPFALTEAEAALLAEVRDGLEEIAGPVDRAWVEHKPSAAVLHTRRSPREAGHAAARAAQELGERLGAHVLAGKDVVEVAVTHTSKGAALLDLRTALGAPVVLYLGDDVTDERAFAVLGQDDVTVKVGPGDTVATFRVDGPDVAAAVLAEVADRCADASG